MAVSEQLDGDEAAVRDGGLVDFGAQRLSITGDQVRLHGERVMNLPEIQRMLHIFEQLIARHGRLFVLLIANQSSEVPSPAVRRYLAEWSRHHRITGVALVGGTVITRALVTLTARAASLVRKDTQPLNFVETEAAAQEWFDGLRGKVGG